MTGFAISYDSAVYRPCQIRLWDLEQCPPPLLGNACQPASIKCHRCRSNLHCQCCHWITQPVPVCFQENLKKSLLWSSFWIACWWRTGARIRCRKDVDVLANIGADFRTLPTGGSWHSLTNAYGRKLRNTETSSSYVIYIYVTSMPHSFFSPDAPLFLMALFHIVSPYLVL